MKMAAVKNQTEGAEEVNSKGQNSLADGRTMFAQVLQTTAFGPVEVWRRLDEKNVRIGNGRRIRAVGRYASVKNGQGRVWESGPELYDIYHAEVDTDVVSYVTQPEMLRWKSGTISRQYTPDRVDNLCDGSRRYVEVKDVYDQERDPRYAEKLLEAAQIYEEHGHSFQVRERAAIVANPLFTSVEEIQAYRRAVVTTADFLAAAHALYGESMPLNPLVERLPRAGSRPVAMAMVVRRLIRIDLTGGLNGDSQVSWLGNT